MKNLALILALALGVWFAMPLANPVLSIAQEDGSEESAPESPAPERPDDGADTGD